MASLWLQLNAADKAHLTKVVLIIFRLNPKITTLSHRQIIISFNTDLSMHIKQSPLRTPTKFRLAG